MRAIGVMFLLPLLVVSGCKNSDTVTGPASAPTPIPPTPTPAFTTLSGRVLGSYNPGGGIRPYPGAQIDLAQSGQTFHATAAAAGTYTIAGLRPGPAIVGASSPVACTCRPAVASLTLKPGMNGQDFTMDCRPIENGPCLFGGAAESAAQPTR
jgi:hypothetical protein